MRMVLLTAGLITLVPQFARADDAEAIVEKAVRAMANSDLRLNRLGNVVRTDRGSLFMPGGEVPVRRTAYLCPPDRIKYEAILTVNGQPSATIMALNGLTAWQQSAGKVEDLIPAQTEAMRDGDADPWALVTLLPLRAKRTTLKILPTKTVNGKNAAGVTVKRPNRPDAQIYFAADTGLPLKVTFAMRDTGLESNRDWDLAEYRDFDGIKLPTRITVTQNGRKIEEWTVQSCRFPDRLEDKVFQKPK
jgi:hypothetical protein